MGDKKIIELKNLFHAFEHRVIFENVNLNIETGTFAFLTGASGTGKTTLLKILHGEIKPLAGMVKIAGFSFGPRKKKFLYKLRRRVTMIHQDFIVLDDLTVEENILLPLRVIGVAKKDRIRRLEIILKSLELLNLRDVKCKFLSGCEKQRVAIGRAIIVNPDVLLADEPTGNLDQKQTIRLLKILKHFNAHGTTVIFATHNPELKKSIPGSREFCIQSKNIQESS